MAEVIKCKDLKEVVDKVNKQIKSKSEPFETIKIAFFTPLMINWFKAFYLKEEEGILMNVECVSLKDTLFSVLNSSNEFRLAKKEEIKLLIIKYLNLLKNELDKNLTSYYYQNSEVDNLKLYDLAAIFTDLFIDYENDQVMMSGDQQKIYEEVMKELYYNKITTIGYLFKQDKKIRNIKNLNIIKTSEFSKLEKAIIDKYSENYYLEIYELENKERIDKDKVKLTACPSKLREIEVLHSSICKNLLEDKETSFNDFLVIAPSLKEYETYINQVFYQDDKEFVKIPVSMSNIKGENLELRKVLDILIDIYSKKNYTRKDFMALIENKIISKKYEFSDEEIKTIRKTILNTNVFRKFEASDDWDYLKKRLLLDKLVNEETEIGDKTYIPYASLDLTNGTINKVIEIIDNLDEFIDALSKIDKVNEQSIQLLQNELDNFVSIKDNDEETNYLYTYTLNTLSFFKEHNIANNELNLFILLLAIKDSATKVIFNKGDMFFWGISFVNFDYKAVYKNKYVYFIGLNDYALPLTKEKSELDLRKEDLNQEYIELQNKTFINQCNNAEKVYFSYLNHDVKDDCDLFKSSFINDIEENEKIELDENRPWVELFTRREYKNKNYYDSLLNKEDEKESEEKEEEQQEKPNKINVKQISEFLYEPFMFKVNYLISKDKDEETQEVDKEFEPDQIDNLTKYKIVPELIKNRIDGKDNEAIYKKYSISHDFPILSKEIKGIRESDLDEKVTAYFEKIDKVNEEIKLKKEVFSTAKITIENESEEIIIQSNDDYLILKNDEEKIINYFKLREIKDDNRELLECYAFSLFHIAYLNDVNDYTVFLRAYDQKRKKEFHLNSKEAKEILIKIYKSMFDFNDVYALPYEDKAMGADELNNFIKELDGMNKPWSYFKAKKMFDYYKDIGYTIENFKDKKKENLKKKKEFIKFSNEVVGEEE